MTKLLTPVIGRGAVALLLACLHGCHSGDTSRESMSSAAPASLAAVDRLPVSPPLPGDNDPAPASPAPRPEESTLGGQLSHEAMARPTGAVRSEDLVAALKSHGVTVARTRQVLGKTLHAGYCAIAVTASGLVASVCEYESAAAARAGLADSETRFGKSMPNRRLLTNGKSVLTIANLQDSVADEARTIAATFAALTPG